MMIILFKTNFFNRLFSDRPKTVTVIKKWFAISPAILDIETFFGWSEVRFPGSRHPTLLDLPSDLVAQGLRWNDGHFFDDPLVRVEIHRQPGVVFLNNDLRGLLDGLGTNATLEGKQEKIPLAFLNRIIPSVIHFVRLFSGSVPIFPHNLINRGTKFESRQNSQLPVKKQLHKQTIQH